MTRLVTGLCQLCFSCVGKALLSRLRIPVEALQVIAQQSAASDNGASPIGPHVKCALKDISAHNLPLGNEKPT